MSAKKILVILHTDQYAYPLIRYLVTEAKLYSWKIAIGGFFGKEVSDRLKAAFGTNVKVAIYSIYQECDQAIRKSDAVIASVPDLMLLQVADSCINYRKPLISPSRLTRQMLSKKSLAEESKTLLLFDCGFSPGLDHITAKKAVDNIHSRGGVIKSFKTYSGSFVPQALPANPWEFKVSEPVSDLINMGKQSNRQLVGARVQHIPYYRLFERSQPFPINGLPDAIAIPEGDSLYYRKIYDLTEAHTVVKGKIFPSGFDRMWDMLIKLGLTDTVSRIHMCGESSFLNFTLSLLPDSSLPSIEAKLKDYCGADSTEIDKLKWLGLLNLNWIEGYKEITPATILQHLIEAKLTVDENEKDYAIMEHQLTYVFRNEHYRFNATLITEGNSMQDSGLASVIGFTCGAAAKMVMLGNISVKGIHIPVTREIYDPILNELSDLGVAFHVEDVRVDEPHPAIS